MIKRFFFLSLFLIAFNEAMEDPSLSRRPITVPSTSSLAGSVSIVTPQTATIQTPSQQSVQQLIANFDDKKNVLLNQTLINQSKVLTQLASLPESEKNPEGNVITLPGSYRALKLLTAAPESVSSFLICNSIRECEQKLELITDAKRLSDFLELSSQTDSLSLFLFTVLKSSVFSFENKLQIIQLILKSLRQKNLDENLIIKNLIRLINGDESASSYTPLISVPGNQPFFINNNLFYISNNNLLEFDIITQEAKLILSPAEIQIKGEILYFSISKTLHQAYFKSAFESVIINILTKERTVLPSGVNRFTFNNSETSDGYVYLDDRDLIIKPFQNSYVFKFYNNSSLITLLDKNEPIRKLIPIPLAFTPFNPNGLIFIKRFDQDIDKANLEFPYIAYIDQTILQKIDTSKTVAFYHYYNPPYINLYSNDLFKLEELIRDKYISKMELSPNGKFLVLLLRKTEISPNYYNRNTAIDPLEKTLSSILVFTISPTRLRTDKIPFELTLTGEVPFEENAEQAWIASLNPHIPEIYIGNERNLYFFSNTSFIYVFSGNTIFSINPQDLTKKEIYSFNVNYHIKEMVVNEDQNYIAVRVVHNNTSAIIIIDLYTNEILNSFPAEPYSSTGPYKRSLALNSYLSTIAYTHQNKYYENSTAIQLQMIINPPTLLETLLIHLLMVEAQNPANVDEKYRLKIYLPKYSYIKNIITGPQLSQSTKKLLEPHIVLDDPALSMNN